MLFCALGPAAAPAQNEELAQVLARMDKAAKAFQGMTVNVHKVSYTAIIKDESVESGVVKMKHARVHEIDALWQVAGDEPKTYEFRNRKVSVYLPKINTVQIYDLGKHGEQLDQFILLGFGTPVADLEKSYTIRLLDQNPLGGAPVAHLELMPTSAEVTNYVKRIELWISTDSGYPVQEKLHQGSGNYLLFTYSGLKLSPVPTDKELELKLPPGVQKEYEGKN